MHSVTEVFLLFAATVLLTSCYDGESDESYSFVDAPSELKALAFSYAEAYRDSQTEYAWGGQDALDAEPPLMLDCSGLVIMCYKYATAGGQYNLLLSDMSVSYMYENASVPTQSPDQGDLIFFTDADDPECINHIAIFSKFEGDNVWFIDSTYKAAEEDAESINGVTERSLSASDTRIKSYAVMRLKQ